MRAVEIDEDMVEWIVAALRESHQDEKAYHEGRVERLQAELARVRARMDAAYEDKLDGKISEEFWERRSAEWRERRLELQAAIESHDKACDTYFDAGVRVLRLAQRAYLLWLAQPQTEKRKLLDILLLNCTFDGGKLRSEYRKPFCWLPSLAEGRLCPVWRGIRDGFLNFARSGECRDRSRRAA